MDLAEFKKKHKIKKTSNLSRFKTEIFELLQDGYSQESICQFLKFNGVPTKQSNLSQFIKRHSQKPDKNYQKTEKVEEIKEPNLQSQAAQKPTLSAPVLFKKSEVKSYEIVEPDYSKYNY